MNHDKAIKIFQKGLDEALEVRDDFLNPLVWIIEDFEIYSKSFVEEVLNRIINPPYIAKINALQPFAPLIKILHYMMTKLTTHDKTRIVNSLYDCSVSILSRGTDSNIKYIAHKIYQWNEEGWIPSETFAKICSAYENPPKKEQMPEIIVATTTIKYKESDEDRRMCRSWMIGSLAWEKADPVELIRPLDPSAVDEEPVEMKYIKITPDNENARCSVCSDSFTRECGKYGWVYTDAEFISGSGYVHIKCKPHLRDFLF